MHAIFGILGHAGPSELGHMAARLAHRGPQRLLWSESGIHLGACGSGRTIADLPLAFAGWLDNKAELLHRCEVDADRDAWSDAQTFLLLYRKLGFAGVALIRGQFAAALWDAQRQRLLLFVDPVAVRPLYVVQGKGRYAFASEYKALLALSDVLAQPNREALQHLQRTKQLYSSGSMLAGIRQLKPGTCLELGGPEPIEFCYRPLKLQIEPRSADGHAHSLHDALLRAAARQTQGHERIGLALSAGVDSLVTLGAIRKVAPHMQIHTFTAGHSEDDEDLEFAASVAHEFGTIHHRVLLQPEALPSVLPQVVWHMEDPIGREEMVFWYLIAQAAAKENISRIFCGNLADLLLGGMPRFFVVQLAARFARAGRGLEEFYNCTQSGLTPKSTLGRWLCRAYYRAPPAAPPTLRGALNSAEYTRFPLHTAEPLNELLIAGLQGQPNPNATCERLYASMGLTYTSPFYDLDVVDCAFQIPGNLKIRGHQQKYILRQAAKDLLPSRMLSRPKGLLRLARNVQLSRVMQSMAEHYLNDARLRTRDLFDLDEVRQLRTLPSDGLYPEAQLYRLWTLLLTEMWAVAFLDNRGAQPGAGVVSRAVSEQSAQPAILNERALC